MKGFLVKYCTKSSLPPSFQRYPFRVIPRKGKKQLEKARGRGREGEIAELQGYHNNYTPGPEKGELFQVNCWMVKELAGNSART